MSALHELCKDNVWKGVTSDYFHYISHVRHRQKSVQIGV